MQQGQEEHVSTQGSGEQVDFSGEHDLGEATRILSTLGSFADLDQTAKGSWRSPSELDLTDVMLLRQDGGKWYVTDIRWGDGGSLRERLVDFVKQPCRP